MPPRLVALAASLLLSLSSSVAWCQTPEWIWHANPDGKGPAPDEVRFFRKEFAIEGKVEKADLQVSCDDEGVVWLNGEKVGSSGEWKKPLKLNVAQKLKPGANWLAIRAKNRSGSAALVAVLEITQAGGKKQKIVTNAEWTSTADEKSGWQKIPAAEGWLPVRAVAKLGASPWGNVFDQKAGAATPAEQLTVPAGFKVELLRSAQPEEGTWVSMAIDPKGRLYISPQGKAQDPSQGGGILRITPGQGSAEVKVERVPAPVGSAMGMLWAFDSLYVSGEGPKGRAIYRVRDRNGDDALEDVELFKEVPGGNGEHGAHALVLGPDNHLYIAHGNSTPLISGIDAASPYRNYQEDTLLPRVNDPVATFFDKLKIPYGYVLRTDENGRKWEIYAGGFRNQYDIDFNADGELFTYDSDMEWDIGLPWYRPTRILHITSGAEFGFREGNSKWPDAYADSLPTLVDIGPGSPTGVKFGGKSNFPERYRRSFFALDWTFGRILSVEMQPSGATYTGNFEEFVKGKGLPVTDLEFGPDGAMYFTVGGRGTQAGLYRVSYVGSSDKAVPSTAASAPTDETRIASDARTLRRNLEAWHTKVDAQAIEGAWPHLKQPDRFLRFAARVAIEAQPVPTWRDRALAEKDARAGLQALLALARCGTKEDQPAVLKALAAWPMDSLDEALKLDKLRVIQVSIARHGRPPEELVRTAIEKLGRQYPAASFALNRELSELLVALGAPDVVEKTLALRDAATRQEEQIWYSSVLREAQTWTPAQRERYFTWFAKARSYKGGNSFAKFLVRIRDQALAKLPENDRSPLLALTEKEDAKPAQPAPVAPARSFVKAWTVADLAAELDQVGRGRNFERGREIFITTQCLQCHHFGPEGGNVGPDLTAVANRFSRRDLLEAIVDPSKGISEQYASYMFTLKSGELIVGQLAEENNDHVKIVTDPIGGVTKMVKPRDIQSKEPSPASLMPPGLINILSKEEVFDLLAYIESGGNPKAAAFAKK